MPSSNDDGNSHNDSVPVATPVTQRRKNTAMMLMFLLQQHSQHKEELAIPNSHVNQLSQERLMVPSKI
eukprot:4464815-Ditylum_brightwellii.AAC.1